MDKPPARPNAAAPREGPPVLDRLRALRCLVAIVRLGSALRAAEAVHLSQPAVTRAVLDLEADCQLRLFDRGARGMAPTEAGRQAAERAQALLTLLARGAEEAQRLAPARQARRPLPERFAAGVAPAGLRAFVSLAQAGSETRAAQSLGVSQPAVHRALGALERLVGVPLFQKSARGSRATQAGEALLRRVQLALAEARALETDLAAWRGGLRGRVVVGALPLSVSLVLPRAVSAVVARHPAVEVRLVDGTYESLLAQLRRADIDLLLGALRPANAADEVLQEVLFEDDLAVVAPPGHALLRRARPRLADLAAHPWVTPLTGSPASLALQRVFTARGLPTPVGVLQAGSPAMTRAFALQTGCLALASRGEALQPEAAPLQLLPVPLPGTTRRIGMVWRANGRPSADLQLLLQALRDAVPEAHKQNE